MDRQMDPVTYSLFLWYMLFVILACCIYNAETVVSTSYFSTSIFTTFYEYSTKESCLSILGSNNRKGKKGEIWMEYEEKGIISKERKEPVAFLLGLLVLLIPLKFCNVIEKYSFSVSQSVVWYQKHRLSVGQAKFIWWYDQFQQTLNSLQNYFFYF